MKEFFLFSFSEICYTVLVGIAAVVGLRILQTHL